MAGVVASNIAGKVMELKSPRKYYYLIKRPTTTKERPFSKVEGNQVIKVEPRTNSLIIIKIDSLSHQSFFDSVLPSTSI